MKDIGFIGLGKLGRPVATAIKAKGFNILGYDCVRTTWPAYEPNPENFKEVKQVGSIKEVSEASIIFVAVQTPHEKHLDGTQNLNEVADFNYDYLKEAIKELEKYIKKATTIAIISTVAPGTIRREILPLINEHIELVYNPFFIAMGTTLKDYLQPEFILMGFNETSSGRLEEFYKEIHGDTKPFKSLSYESAELVKMGYNTFITQKINFANWLMQICNAFSNADIDEVMNTLKSATDRVISTAYLNGGMGDGGACHPRDNIVMEWLSNEYGFPQNPAQSANIIRNQQAKWLVFMILEHLIPEMDVVIYGYSYKPNTPLIQGSPALLVANLLREHDIEPILIDPIINGDIKYEFNSPILMLLGCNHDIEFPVLPPDSIVIDPFRLKKDFGKNVKVYNLGAGEKI